MCQACPNCGSLVLDNDEALCPGCGEALLRLIDEKVLLGWGQVMPYLFKFIGKVLSPSVTLVKLWELYVNGLRDRYQSGTAHLTVSTLEFL